MTRRVRPFASLSSRILLLVLLAVVPALALLWRSGGRERDNAAWAARRRAQQAVVGAAREHDRLVEGARVLLASLAHGGAARGPGCDTVLASLRRVQPAFANIGVVDAAGTPRCSAAPLAAHDDLRDAPWIAEAMRRGEVVLAEYAPGALTDASTFVVGYALPVRARAPREVAFVLLRLTWIEAMTREAGLPAGTTVSVVDPAGRILARFPEPSRWVGQMRPDAPVVRAMLERQRGTVDAVGLDGVARLYAFSALTVNGVPTAFLSVGIPAAAAYADANRRTARNLAVLGAVAGFALAIALVMGRALILRRSDAVVAAADRLRRGDYSARTGLAESDDELGAVAAAFDRMAQALEADRAELERAQRQLRASRRRTRRLARHAERGRERERARISREVHDQLGGLLTAMKMDVTAMRTATPAGQDALRGRATVVLGLIDEAVATVRRVASELRPGILDDLGLSAAIEWQSQDFARRAAVALELDLAADPPRVRSDVATALFRILQEALTNVARHADATCVGVRYGVVGRNLVLEIWDDGRGMGAAAHRGASMGVLGMLERSRTVGGRTAVRTRDGGGTEVRVTVPLARAVRGAHRAGVVA